ncbi:MAG: GNAT family N-acetyltransferase [Burkholderiaceae bacterium]|jgi:RimJ/RimL family protein N-acetyltransferase
MSHTPTLETERLILRPLVLSDFEAYVSFWQNPEVVRYISGAPIPRDASWTRLLRTAGHWQFLGFGFFAIEHKATRLLIGEVGFQEMRRVIEPSIEGTLETGWGILPEYQGQGMATEVVRAALEWAGLAHPRMEYSCIVSPENQPSLKLAAKFGFEKDTTTTFLGKPVVILRRGRSRRGL